MKKGSLYSIVFMMLITSVFTFILSFLNNSTVQVISINQEIQNQKKILIAFDIPFDSKMNTDEIQALYSSHIHEEKINKTVKYTAYDNDKLIGYGFIMDGPGLWGQIKGIIALNKSLDKVLGIEFFSHSETPGLGGRIDENWFKNQFRNITLLNTNPFITYLPDNNGQVEGISGATITSKAVLNIINDEIESFKSLEKEVKSNVEN